MPEFVREHAGDLVGVFRLRQKSAEHVDLAARQREGVRHFRRQHRGLHIGIEAGGFAQLSEQLRVGRLSRRTIADLFAEHGPDLHLGGFANPPLEGLRHQRREPVRGERNGEQHDHDDRRNRRDRPADNLRDRAAIRPVLVRAARSARRARPRARRRGFRAAPAPARTGSSRAARPRDCRPDGCRHRSTAPAQRRLRRSRARRRKRALTTRRRLDDPSK